MAQCSKTTFCIAKQNGYAKQNQPKKAFLRGFEAKITFWLEIQSVNIKNLILTKLCVMIF